jgi:DNA-binding transcriptional LysR family regulator
MPGNPTPQPALDWADLQYFSAVGHSGSIAGAARTLRVNHSTVLRRIASLEAALGVRLFDRLPGGYALTTAGNELNERLAGLAGQVEAAQRHLTGRDAAITGTIRLTTTDTLLHGLLMPVLARFHAAHPGVQMQVAINNSFSSLTQREADVALRGSNRPPPNLVGRRVGDIQTALYASRAYLKSLGRNPEVAAYRWVGTDESLAHLEQAKWLRKHVEEARVTLRVDSLVGMVDAVAHGLGAGLLLCPLADARSELVRLAPPDPALDTQVWILTHPDLRQVARMRVFTQFVFDALSVDVRLAH